MNKQQEPRLRFKGFTGAWKEQKIIEIAEYVDYRGKTPRKTEEGIFLITAKNVKMGSLDYKVSQEFIAIEDFESVMSRGKAEIGDVLITTEAPLGNVAQIDREDVALAQRVIKYRGIKGILNNDFLTQKFLTNTFQATLGSLSSGGTVQGIKGSLLHQIEIKYPSLPEQTHLGLFFRRLDSQIAESRAVLEKSHQLKKAMLAKMFPANGEKIPKIRFKGFEGEWEEESLGKIGEFSAGGDINKEKLMTFGRYPVLANALTNNGIVGFYNNYEFESPAITITGRGDVGIAKARKENFSAVVRLLVLKNKPNYDVDFLEQAINKIDFHTESTGVPQLTVPQCKSYSIHLPSYKEQTAIGNFFRQLDETIALQLAEVEKLNQLKKGLLAAMLI
jgi:type Ic restriction-modification system, hsdS subunit